MQSLYASHARREPASSDEVHLLRKLKMLLAARTQAGQGHSGAMEIKIVEENRLLIRDCISRLRYLRAAGGRNPWMGLGKREERYVSS